MHETLEVPAYRTLHILTPLQAVKNVILEKKKKEIKKKLAERMDDEVS